MRFIGVRFPGLAVAMLFALAPPPVAGAEIRLLASNGIRTVVEQLVPAFERATGNTVVVSYGVAAALKRQIDDGQPFDVAILTPAAIDALIAGGRIERASRTVIARSPIALAIRRGAPKADVSSADALTRTLLAATSIAYAREGASAPVFTSLEERLELTTRLASKVRAMNSGAEVGAAVARGEAQLGVLPISEILPVAGIEVLAAFPPPVAGDLVMVGAIGGRSTQRTGAAALLASMTRPEARAVLEARGMRAGAAAARAVPTFAVDASWPTIPNHWQFGWVASVAVDARDHVWVLQRPGSLPAADKPRAAPPVLEFAADGTFVQAWGGPGRGYQWPESEHGIYVDAKGFVWIGGNGARDHQILKFTRRGGFVMQIGHAGQSTGNADRGNLNRPADVFVYPKTNELFVADGYGNRRVIVFDADSGRFKRMWGAFGDPATDAAPNPAGADESERGASQFVQPVHAARVSNDGLVYVSDRGGKRVQVFTVEGRFVSQVFIGRECKAPACGNGQTAAATAFSADPAQQFLYVGNASQAKVMILDRRTLEVLGSFGRAGSAPGEFGTLHHLTADSKGNIYVTEVAPARPENRRVQKFRLVTPARAGAAPSH
jgi:ABC-type molybdate transport system substrate-binding protein/DNA-binding beta-propeller fold protein YncE